MGRTGKMVGALHFVYYRQTTPLLWRRQLARQLCKSECLCFGNVSSGRYGCGDLRTQNDLPPIREHLIQINLVGFARERSALVNTPYTGLHREHI